MAAVRGEGGIGGANIAIIFSGFNKVNVKQNRSLIAQQIYLAREAVHPDPCFPGEVDRISKGLVDCDQPLARNQVVGVRDDLLFGCGGDAVAGPQAQQRALVRREAGAGVAFHNTGEILRKALLPQEIRSALGMADVMGPAPPDIMEHCTLLHEKKIDIGIPGCIPAGAVPDRPAMPDDFPAAPGIVQQFLASFLHRFRHGQAIS